ncbi:hypothetical protein LBRM_23_1960 [Leishmania braziliensis MHOM/BR/75/M2904]|uniref:Uncharacterized protein n=2 Tax=Leishmania braziliensis TaxID=5660 RepID=A4HD56_LEIBR|nr:hypothetical protein LBRM_23_1960 [Leishmania braziliensis MHOM/BR/75/M2904]CAJ2474796.1 unnamed protein product [Leishmania braziliensis]CAJ2475297.1 unnamed protein product [Leishmania braziliensis]CAM36703.1 hypothetical protein LBRM_23_1960 [Leishmania braziliensis MHOM/BR/75/M2904]SYZ66833.1 hypothetical_protein [Leishmania braziliensis MHOM/BR/75/M2904]
MVKKADSHARVLRPGESIALSRKSSEFEIVLFRPRHHDRAKAAKDSALEAEVTASSPVRDSSQEPMNYTGGVNTALSKARIRISSTGNEVGHGEKRRSGGGYATLRSSALGPRDASEVVDVDERTAAPFAPGAMGGGNEGRAPGNVPADAPLFFDTAVCIFYDELAKMDYVAPGRTTIDSKGLHYKPHLVVLGTESAPGGYCNFNITRSDGEPLGDGEDDAFEEDSSILVNRTATSNGPVTMAAADGVEVSLRRLSMCAGFLVCATLFGKDTCLNRERNVFYMVRRPRSSTPLCLVPLCMYREPNNSCVSLMVRKVRLHGETIWELVSVSEPLPFKDMKSLIMKLQGRGLTDPAHFARDCELKAVANRGGDGAGGGTEEDVLSSSGQSSSTELEASASHKRLSDTLEQERSRTSMRASLTAGRQYLLPSNRTGRTFSTLLIDVPRVTREGRRQYSVGKSHVQTALFDGDTSEVDEVLDDAMRAVVPCYADASLVRYENGAYNVGSRVGNLVAHYVGHREKYGLDAASQRSTGVGRPGGSRDELLPFLGALRVRSSADLVTPLPVLDRCRSDDSEIAARPKLPADLLFTSQDRLLAAGTQQHRGSIYVSTKKRHSILGQAGRSSSHRRSGGRKGKGRAPSARAGGTGLSRARKKARGARGSKPTSRIPGSRSTSGSPQPPPSSSLAHKLTAHKMHSRVSSGKSRGRSGNQTRSSERSGDVAA